jgi:hypothetical protein
MSLEHSPGRQRRRQRRARTDVEPVVYSVRRFCDSHEISRTHLYEQWRKGIGPRFYWQGDEKRITAEAAAEWVVRMQAASDALTETKSEI